MSPASETALSLLQSAPQTNTPTALVGALFLTMAACVLQYISPSRLTAVLVGVLHEAEEVHIAALEAGVLSGFDGYTRMLSSLQVKASIIRETSLGISLSNCQTLLAVIKGHSFTLLQCIWEIQQLKTRIEILKERQLRHIGSLYAGTPAQTMAARRSRPSVAS